MMSNKHKQLVVFGNDSATRAKPSFTNQFNHTQFTKSVCILLDCINTATLEKEEFVNADVKCFMIQEHVRYSECDKFVAQHHEIFDIIFTDQKDIDVGIPHAKLVHVPYGAVWVDIHKEYSKDIFGVSYLPGSKNLPCFPGHQMRREVFQSLTVAADRTKLVLHPELLISIQDPAFYLPTKEPIFTGFQFSIVIENVSGGGYFTEKLNDAIATKTVPIYWGAPDIGEYFDVNGMFIFNSIDQLFAILSSLTPQTYDVMTDAVERNYQKLKETPDMKKSIGKYLQEYCSMRVQPSKIP